MREAGQNKKESKAGHRPLDPPTRSTGQSHCHAWAEGWGDGTILGCESGALHNLGGLVSPVHLFHCSWFLFSTAITISVSFT